MFKSLRKRISLISLLKDLVVFGLLFDLFTTYIGISKYNLEEAGGVSLYFISKFGLFDGLVIKFISSFFGVYFVYLVSICVLLYFRKIKNTNLEDGVFYGISYTLWWVFVVYAVVVLLNCLYIFMSM